MILPGCVLGLLPQQSEENVFKPDGGDPSKKVVHYNH